MGKELARTFEYDINNPSATWGIEEFADFTDATMALEEEGKLCQTDFMSNEQGAVQFDVMQLKDGGTIVLYATMAEHPQLYRLIMDEKARAAIGDKYYLTEELEVK